MTAAMTPAEFGTVLMAMSNFAKQRANIRAPALGNNNRELLYGIAFMLEVGAQKCLDLAQPTARQDDRHPAYRDYATATEPGDDSPNR